MPHFEVPEVELPNQKVARHLNHVVTQLQFAGDLEDSTGLPDATQAIRRAAAEYKANNQVGIFGASYEVLFNQGGLLSLALTTEYSGAYPWSATRHATFDVRTGRLLTLADLLADTVAVSQRWQQRINQRVAAHLLATKREYPTDSDAWAAVREYTNWDAARQQINPAARPALRNFALTNQGLMLYTDFGFPHVVLALAPPSEYLFPYAELKQGAALRRATSGLR